MDNRTYINLYRQARNRTTLQINQVVSELQKIYKLAANDAAAVVRAAELAGHSQLTIESWRAINEQLTTGATRIAMATQEQLVLGASDAYFSGYARIDEEYIMDVVNRSGNTLITRAGIQAMSRQVNNDLITSLINRQYQTPTGTYMFQSSVWNTWVNSKKVSTATGLFFENSTGIFGDYQVRIRNIINAGLAQGRDPIRIASDIQEYVTDIGKRNGQIAVFNQGRYGRLVPGAREYARRIPGRIDWRALRLVRSEMYASLQESAIRQSRINPAATSFVDWHKRAGNPIDPVASRTNSGMKCIEIQEDNPWNVNNVPNYNHANCSCWINPVMKPVEEFTRDLKEWNRTGRSLSINRWYQDVYRPAQFF